MKFNNQGISQLNVRFARKKSVWMNLMPMSKYEYKNYKAVLEKNGLNYSQKILFVKTVVSIMIKLMKPVLHVKQHILSS